VAGGAFTTFNGIALNCLARLNTDGSLDSTNFFPARAPTMWFGASRSSRMAQCMSAGNSRRSTARTASVSPVVCRCTVDTTFLDTAYNQFAGLKRIYSDDTPRLCSGVQSDGNVMIGGTFYQWAAARRAPASAIIWTIN